jgi:hypothetical protein
VFCVLADTDFLQQRLKAHPASITTFHLAIAIIVLGIFFIPAGTKLSATNRKVLLPLTLFKLL